MKAIVGKTPDGANISLNLSRLIETRLLLQANSGGGKSWAIRRILEQTHGSVQQIVIDVEDEFHTLREHYDYILAGSQGGDCPADTKSAALLARRLLELGVSAIIGIFELKAHDRIRFVRLFLDALVNAPRELWHPVLVVIDEAHMFCPQQGEAESAGAVIDLMTRGRKRGFCGILATQRISKLHKDAAAEANNKLIGRSALDVDMKRAADELGFSSRDDQAVLRTLKPGEFFCFGPALSDIVTKAKVGDIRTSHPRAGQQTAPPAPPRAQVRAVLSKLADLPHAAEQEAQTVVALQSRVRELERELRAKLSAPPASPPKRIEIPILKESQIGRLEKIAGRFHEVGNTTLETSRALVSMISKASQMMKGNGAVVATVHREDRPVHIPMRVERPPSDGQLPKAEKLILTALAQYPEGRTKVQVAILTGYSVNSGGFNNSLARLRASGMIAGLSGQIKITEQGIASLGSYDPLPTGTGLLDHWRSRLPKCERSILLELAAIYPNPISKQELGERTGYSENSGGFNNALSRLRTLELINRGPEIRASEEFF